MDSKEQIMSCYEEYITRLTNGINQIQAISAKNKKFEKILQKCLEDLQVMLEESRSQMQQVMKETVWDKLVIAFFGETNAGKSTIIETFRVKFNDASRLSAIEENGGEGVDGLIVGDGRQDFTQVYEKYNLMIDDHPFIMIDVPGIEGKESFYLEEISSALKQAHCIFYVQGHNKKPDAATTEKIKRFLSDWVDVYSIYNVKGGVSNYDEEEERETLLTPSVEKVQQSITDVFNTVLPGVYRGNVTCQGYLALMSVASFHKTRSKLIKDQEKITSYFNGRENVESFSRFDAITELVKSQSVNFSEHILEANRQKLDSLQARIRGGIDSTIANQTEGLDKYITQLRTFKNNVVSAQSDVQSILQGQIQSELSQVFSALKTAANDIIDNAGSQKEWSERLSNRFSRILSRFESVIKSYYSEAYTKFKEKVEAKRKDLDSILYRKITIPDIDLDVRVDISRIMEPLRYKFKDDFLKSIFDGVFNPIGTLIKVFTDPDDGRDEAKRNVSEELEKAKSFVRGQLDKETEVVSESLKKEVRSIEESVNSEMSNIRKLDRELIELRHMFSE
ncbi:MAG: 50S ribosome-binding GTPase [Bacteroidales bacterium]|nr:50S ribosome-binding GTPase [Bacteroidales bacterium]